MVTAQTLGSLGRAAQPAFPRLVPLLVADQPDIREAAVAAMGSLELEAEVIRPHIAKALRDDKPEVRRAASRAVQRLGPQGAILIPDIIMLADRKENLRSAERLLRRFERSGPNARSLPELVKLLEHKQPSVRLLAIKFLGLAGRSASTRSPPSSGCAKIPTPRSASRLRPLASGSRNGRPRRIRRPGPRPRRR